MTRVFVVALVLLASAGPARAQSVRYRRPYDEGYRLNYGYDHDGSAAGCTDYSCGGSCYDGHSGSDLGTPLGTTVLAAASGVVTGTNDGCANYGGLGNTCGGRCGNYVRIRHDDGSVSLYCHMLLGSIAVSYGQHVSCGQPIGRSASSGNSTGPHLHFGHTSPGAGSSSDPWAGGCSRSTSLWVDQGGYRGPPSTECSDRCSPSGESCNGVDDDCDGRTDEDLRRGCGTDVGECVSGISSCSGGRWGSCDGEVPPREEDCNGRDDDCDGSSDESLVRRCGTDVGECVSGTQRCESTAWTACEGSIVPVPERCDRLDDDCDGATDEAQTCEREETLWGAPVYAAAHRTSSDVDGDGRADACAVSGAGLACFLATAHGFERAIGGGAPIGGDLASAASLRTGDVDGDGRDDLCFRAGDRFACQRSLGDALGPLDDHGEIAGATSAELADIDGDGRLDACVRDASGLSCRLANGHVALLPALSDDAGFADVVHHGSLRFGDLDGDGRDDVCARDANGVVCWISEGERFGDAWLGPRWSDAAGFDAVACWGTLRLADVDGDGRDDVCARTPTGFFCARSLGRSFGALLAGPAMQGEAWLRADGYGTIRMGDVDGDGREDLCAREDEHARCWLSSGHALDRVVEGPSLRDDEGFSDHTMRYRSIRLADVDGDARADLCARYAEGLRCFTGGPHGFEREWRLPAWSDASGPSSDAASATIRLGGLDPSARRGLHVEGVFACRAAPGRAPAGLAALALGLIALSGRARARRSR
ncbi:MAG: VCBS repeat domain-containing M23 family metallopeptidase [Sandaracinus sp.]